MAIIRTQGLRRDFGGHPAVAGLDLEVAEGEIFGLVGPDGAGKTTTMRMLTGILPPTAGSAEVAGCDVSRDAERLKEQIGYMSQRFGLYPDLTVAENIDFYADIYSVPARGRAARTEQLLGFSNLTPFRHRLAGNLSGGMKQKLGLACALIHTPRVLFLDEPTNGVDPVSRRDFWRILYQLVREGVTIFVSTAYLDEAERCNRLALLHEGRLIGLGTPDEVKTLMPGTLLEVRTADPRRAAVVLRAQLPDATVGLFGDRVHVTSRAGLRPALSTPHRESIAQGQVKDLPYSEPTSSLETRIRAALAAENLELHSLRPIEPSLEDVFVSAIGTPPASP